MNSLRSWDHVASQVAALPRPEFATSLRSAPSADRSALLKMRFRWRADEFAEAIMRPIISREARWSPLTDFNRAMLTVPVPFEGRGASVASDLTLAPRGVSKTTSKQIMALHACLYGYEPGIAALAAAHRLAIGWTSTVLRWAAEPEVVALYGPPIIEGTQADLKLNATYLWARGWNSSVRGLKQGAVRPTWIILDDIESERNTRTLASIEATRDLLQGAVANLGPNEGGHRIDMLATPVSHDCVSAGIYRGDVPELTSWVAHRWPAVVRWPEHSVWEEVEATYRDVSSGLTPDERWTAALALLQDYPDALDGAETIDPVRMPITTALRRKIDRGPIAWAREFQVLPQVPGSTLFEPDGWPRFRVDGPTARSADGTARAWKSLKLALAYDPSEGGDDGALALLGRAQTGQCFILDSERLTTRASLQVPHVVSMAKRWGLNEVLVEANQMPSLLRQAIEDEAREQGVRLSVIEVRQTRNKEIRLSALEAPASNGLLAVREDIPTHHLRLIEAFDPRRRDNRDDILDAIEMAYSHLTKTGARFHGRPLF